MIKITSLGGAGEDSRNCFLLQTDELNVLLDCGVRREIASVDTVYPLLTGEIAEKLDCVIISHAHEDHTAALPYLYSLGYTGAVYASKETIELIPGYMEKWIAYVQENNGILPFDPDEKDKVVFRPIEELDLDVTWGRSGHMIGSLWYLFTLEGHRILYTGDATFDSMLLQKDPFPQADTLIIDSAYASRHLNQKQQFQTISDLAQENNTRILLPVPANGRGIDLFEYLKPFDFPLYVEPNIIKNTDKLFTETGWIKDIVPSEGEYVTADENIRSADLPGVWLFGDGMMTTAVAREYFESVRHDPEAIIIISGHSARGTLANNLLKEEYRQANDIRCQVMTVTIKVHLDEDDVLKAVKSCGAQNVMLFHSRRGNCSELAETLNSMGINTVCETGITLIID